MAANNNKAEQMTDKQINRDKENLTVIPTNQPID